MDKYENEENVRRNLDNLYQEYLVVENSNIKEKPKIDLILTQYIEGNCSNIFIQPIKNTIFIELKDFVDFFTLQILVNPVKLCLYNQFLLMIWLF